MLFMNTTSMPLGLLTLRSTKLDTMMRLNPSRAASAMRCSVRGAGRTSPDSPISPAQHTFSFKGLS